MRTDHFAIGTKEAIEAEFGLVAPNGFPFVLVSFYDGEEYAVEDFKDWDIAKAQLADIDGGIIEVFGDVDW